MKLFVWKYNRLFLWITIACVSTQVVDGDELIYGMRIKPLLTKLQPHEPHSNCQTCIHNAQNSKENSTQVHRTESKLEVQTSVKHKGLGFNRRTDDQNLYRTSKPLINDPEIASSKEAPKDNSKKGATFFFTQVEPHRFEYRAMFQHQRNTANQAFQPFVHDFDSFGKEFPPLPKFPSFPSIHDFFQDTKDPFPNFPEFSFPTLPPVVKRTWQPSSDGILNPIKPILEEKIENPILNPVVKDYDVVLGHAHYPKIFRFNEERINIEEFDREKKLRFYSLREKEQNELLEPENVKRDHLLILHGGIFTVQEPPLFNKRTHIKKRRKLGNFRPFRSRL